MQLLQSALRLALIGSVAAGTLLSRPALAASPSTEAIKEQREGDKVRDIVQNRFFLKSNRFEIAPTLGYVPNNPFAKRYVGGVMLAYHLSESFAAEGSFMYSPDLGNNDLKGLVSTLVLIASSGTEDVGFQQPVDKMTLGASFAVRWAPVYGKINILGERVLNFDFYGVAGLGLLSIAEYYATYNEESLSDPTQDIVKLTEHENLAAVAPNLGVGFDFFLNQTLAIKIDARDYLYVGSQPNYDPESEEKLDSRLYNNFIASVGVSIFVPPMKPRLYDF